MPELLRTLLTASVALAAVLGIIVLAGRGVRMLRMARPAAGRRLVLIEALALDRVRRLHLIACDGRELMLLTGGGADQVVGWLPSPTPVQVPGA